MGLLSRFRAEPPPPLVAPGVVEEPLDEEGLLAVVRSLSEPRVAGGGGQIAPGFEGYGWKVYDNGGVEDHRGDSRCVSIKTALLSRIRLDIAERAGSTTEANRAWESIRNANVPAVNLLALAVGIASDPAGVDRLAGR